MKKMRQSKLFYTKNLPARIDFQNSILIYDHVLEKKFRKWIFKFPRRLKVQSGEELKSLNGFPKKLEQILKLSEGLSRDKIAIVAMGGGSVGDFSGFVASVLKRGVSLIQIPSTWLSAVDSAHGGKTALNSSLAKNQIGTFYPAHEIYITRDLLYSQPEERIDDVLGEYYKTVLISGGELFRTSKEIKNVNQRSLWGQLPKLIEVKQKIVKKDPYEKKGLRHILNLGHTVGHVIESELGVSHGRAVWLGLRFAINWGEALGWYLNLPEHFLPTQGELREALKKIKKPELKLIQDKKITDQKSIQFVFLQRPGKAKVKKVSLKEVVKEWQRQAAKPMAK